MRHGSFKNSKADNSKKGYTMETNLSFQEFEILKELSTKKVRVEDVCDDVKKRQDLTDRGLVDAGGLTAKGMDLLQPYKVDNAVIMAAGLSSRFVPLSYDKPKGLTVVKGEVLIERQIRQLQAVGIQNIFVIVGYMKELFFYLEDKFNVKLVINNDYALRNNTGSLWLVKDKLANSYICSSDDYFTENVFEPYVYRPYYAVEFMHGSTTERGAVTDEDGRIVKTYPGAEDDWALMGHVYWNRTFSESFINRLATIYDDEATKPLLWERVFDRFLEVLPPLYARKYDQIIYEFDTLAELKEFDPEYLTNADSSIMDNICGVLDCKKEELSDFALMNAGLTNSSFSFLCRKQKYVYRHCFPFSRNVVDRARESAMQNIAVGGGFDSTCLYLDADKGWKISRFVEHTSMDFNNEEHLATVIDIMHRVHEVKVDEKFRINFRKEIENVLNLLTCLSDLYANFQAELKKTIFRLLDHVENDNWPLSLTHDDINKGNFLVHDGGCDLIDWEYSGLNDRAYDIAKLVLKAEAVGDRARQIISAYYGRDCTAEEERHILACGAIEDYYWLIWAMYLEQNGKNLQNDIYIWYRHAKEYGKIALRMYEPEHE